MQDISHSKSIVSLYRLMRLFGISLFSILSATPSQIRAFVAWEDDCIRGLPKSEDLQEILWHVPETDDIDDALSLGEFAFDNGWIDTDSIIISKDKLQCEINWGEERFNVAIERLLLLKAVMIDDGEETDTFFLHFEK